MNCLEVGQLLSYQEGRASFISWNRWEKEWEPVDGLAVRIDEPEYQIGSFLVFLLFLLVVIPSVIFSVVVITPISSVIVMTDPIAAWRRRWIGPFRSQTTVSFPTRVSQNVVRIRRWSCSVQRLVPVGHWSRHIARQFHSLAHWNMNLAYRNWTKHKKPNRRYAHNWAWPHTYK